MFRRIFFPVKHKIRTVQNWQHKQIRTLNNCTTYRTCSTTQRNVIQNINHSPAQFRNQNLSAKHFTRCLTSESASADSDVKYDEVSHTTITKRGEYLELRHNDEEFTIPYIWLRDHCRCSRCYYRKANQRNAFRSFTPEIKASNIELQKNGTLLNIRWDDGHETEYDVNWLVDNAYTTRSKVKIPPMLWDGAKILSEPLPIVDYDSYMNTESGLREALYKLLKYGLTIVKGVPATVEGTQEAVERVSFVCETMYGKVWVMRFKGEMGDIGYTKIEIGAHTDTTYYTLPAGIQALHCLHHEGTGGENWLVDGFQVAEKLRHDDPEAFDNLTKQIVPHEFIDKGFNLQSLGRVLTVHPASKEMQNIRYNPSDLAPLDTISPNELEQFYTDYNKLTKLIRDPANCFRVKLNPGMLLLLNNWRVLHARDSFTGDRALFGCYISHDDWMSKARLLGLA